MKRDIVDMLACPICNGDMSVTINNGDQHEVLDGILHCPACDIDYPIEEGIPLLIPPSKFETTGQP